MPAPRVFGASVAAVVVWTAVTTAAFAGETTIAVNYGGYAFCNVCGVADYTVPGLDTWNDGNSSFVDPLPSGAVVVQMTASLRGTGDGTADVSVGGTPLGVSTITGSTGLCDVCDAGSPASSATYDGGFPGYIYGGTTAMHLASASSTLALDHVSLTIVYRLCGDGVTDNGEVCDTGGDTASCDADCTPPICGDGRFNAAAEACDEGGDTATCDGDCTPALCGDGHLNIAAGEACDEGDILAGDGCSSSCQIEPATSSPASTSSAGGGGDGGAGDGGDTSSAVGSTAGPTGGGEGGAGAGSVGPTASGIAVVSAAAGPADDDDDDDDDDGASDDDDSATSSGAGTGGDGAADGGASGCGCVIPRGSTMPSSVAIAGLGLAVAVIRRVRKRRANGLRARG